MKALLTLPGLASTGLTMVFVGGVFLGLNQMGSSGYKSSYDRIKISRRSPINSMNCMSGPWNDCIADVKRSGWSKTYRVGR
jgi:hypothetical protein